MGLKSVGSYLHSRATSSLFGLADLVGLVDGEAEPDSVVVGVLLGVGVSVGSALAFRVSLMAFLTCLRTPAQFGVRVLNPFLPLMKTTLRIPVSCTRLARVSRGYAMLSGMSEFTVFSPAAAIFPKLASTFSGTACCTTALITQRCRLIRL